MKYCKFILVKEYPNNTGFEYRCEVCNRKLTTLIKKDYLLECYAALSIDKVGPTNLQKAKNFVIATTKHVVDGGRRRSTEEIERIYDICKTCPLFVATNEDKSAGYCSHKDCGCNLAGSNDKFLNKIAWESESCPLHKW